MRSTRQPGAACVNLVQEIYFLTGRASPAYAKGIAETIGNLNNATSFQLTRPFEAPATHETYRIPGTTTVLFLTFYPGNPLSPTALRRLLGEAYREVEKILQVQGDVPIPDSKYSHQYYDPSTRKRVRMRLYAESALFTWNVVRDVIEGIDVFSMMADRDRKIGVDIKTALTTRIGRVYIDNGLAPMVGLS
ncbi:MAG: hypothetical protein LQ350_003260 [Teloschistes chrysophthalmus]|nr:MAG: hypothetical protein LQ350_003260 [Niorma chrysophthalma]